MTYTDMDSGGQAEPGRRGPNADTNSARKWFLDQVARAKKVGQFTVKASLTPALARALRVHHMPEGSNRRLRLMAVEALAATIKAGRWNSNTHQGIAFSAEGIVNDGQHRINAVADAGVAIEILMTFGQPRSTFEVIDQSSRPRNAADLLMLSGMKVGTETTAASVAKAVLAVRAIQSGVVVADALRANRSLDILGFARDNPKRLHDAVNAGRNVAAALKTRVSPANIAAAFYLIMEQAPDAARIAGFIESLRTGANLSASSPILVCREGLRAGEFGKHLRTATDRRLHEIAAVVNAWNLWRAGRSIKTRGPLSITDGNEFPSVAP